MQVPDFSAARVLVAGDLMLDRYWHGGTSRISPEAPVPVVLVNGIEERAGGAGNVALNIAALGSTVELLGYCGRDEAGARLLTLLEQAGIRCAIEQTDGLPTITKLRVLSRHQQLIRLDFEEHFHALDSNGLVGGFREKLGDADAVVLSDYGKGTLREIPTLIELARAAGKPVLADPKGIDFDQYRGATLITPNRSEFEAVAGPCRDEGELVEKGHVMVDRLELDALLITRGEHGMTLLQKDRPARHLPAQAKEVYDVTGAGDTVISVLAAALAAGCELPEATQLANVAAGLAETDRLIVTGTGPDYVSAREMALKVTEGARLAATAIELETVMHGHLAAATRWTGLVVIATEGARDGLPAERLGRVLDAARALSMPAAALLDESTADSLHAGLTPAGRISLPHTGRVGGVAGALLAPLIPFQLVAERLARARGVDPDTIGREDEAQAAAHA
jgi:D-beta-D-heptose 7-phosphate kinase/D-beta-D-heptose 1-phosphate adenosyltransferase